MQNILQQNAVLVRLSATMPGQHRKDKSVTEEVKKSKGLGEQAGRWVKDLWPEDAMAAIKKKMNEARDVHATFTLPFGARSNDSEAENKEANKKGGSAIAGIGVLPSALLFEYGEKMRKMQGELALLIDEFLDNPTRYIDWAVKQHNGTFEPENYPGCDIAISGSHSVASVMAAATGQTYWLDEAVFKDTMRAKFSLSIELLPIPDSGQFAGAVEQLISLAGLDAKSVDNRVADATVEGQRELLRRMIAPVQAMAEKLVEEPKSGKQDIVFRDTLIGNISDIVRLAPKLNLAGDPQIDAFCQELDKLTRYSPQVLRDDKATRQEAADKAASTLKRLSGYKI